MPAMSTMRRRERRFSSWIRSRHRFWARYDNMVQVVRHTSKHRWTTVVSGCCRYAKLDALLGGRRIVPNYACAWRHGSAIALSCTARWKRCVITSSTIASKTRRWYHSWDTSTVDWCVGIPIGTQIDHPVCHVVLAGDGRVREHDLYDLRLLHLIKNGGFN